MSDVWQGPGWWLASDGKWYPADAEPGAVYEGDLNNSDSPSTDASQEATPGEVDPVDEMIQEIEELEPVTPAEVPEVPVAEVPEVEVPDAFAEVDPDRVEVALDEPTSMPDPIVDASGGGWQTIDEAPTEVPEPSLESQVVEDGWTSAFEERQAGSEVLDDAVEVAPPTIDVPDTAIPDLAIPDAAIPDVAAPAAIPDAAIPDAAIPDAAIPDLAIPDAAIPEVTVPNVEIPEVAIPDVAAPDVAIPEVTAPVVSPPTMSDIEAAADGREQAAPIERQDAWRKPISPEAPRVDAETAPRGTPDVVDLAIRDDVEHEVVEPPNRNWRNWAGLLAALALVILIAWLIAKLFAGNASTDTADTDSTPTTTESVSTSTEDDAPAVTDAEETTSSSADTEAEAPSTTEEDASVFDLRAGDCIVGDIGAGQVTKVRKVDCEVEHQFEVYREALIESSITTFDEAAISAYAEEVCRTSLAAYIPANDDRNLKFKFLQPTEDSWNQAEDPDRVITCLLFDGDGDPLIGRAEE